MRKLLLSASALLVLFACQNDDGAASNADDKTTLKRGCAAHEVLERQLAEDPTMALRMNEIEDFTQRAIAEGRLVNGKIVIPVVVNVLYKTAAENISLAQIQSQIDVLNQDFTATNSDWNQVPTLFSGVKSNVDITFELETVKRLQKAGSILPALIPSSTSGFAPSEAAFWVMPSFPEAPPLPTAS